MSSHWQVIIPAVVYASFAVVGPAAHSARDQGNFCGLDAVSWWRV